MTWKLEEAYAAAHADLSAKVYVSIGSPEHPGHSHGSPYEMVEDVRKFERLLFRRGYPSLELRATVVDGHNHETVFPIVLTNGVHWDFNARRDVPFGY